MSESSPETVTKPSLDTLIQDVHQLFSPVVGRTPYVDKAIVEAFGESVKQALTNALLEPARDLNALEAPRLRMSRMGRPLRQIWFEQHAHEFDLDSMGAFARHEVRSHLSGLDPSTKVKMLYGHIIEALVIALVKMSGHKVEHEQRKVTLNGIEGSLDCYIDGVLTDVKSASSYAFKKFSEATLFENDPFGYRGQISGYAQAEGQTEAAFLAFNKENAELAIMRVNKEDMMDMPAQIEKIKEVATAPHPPEEKCYPEEQFGKSNNKTINKNCGWCKFKHLCWKDVNGGKGLRVFDYAYGPAYLTEVNDTPRVPEITEATHNIGT